MPKNGRKYLIFGLQLFITSTAISDTSDQVNNDTAISDQILLIVIDQRSEKTAIYKPGHNHVFCLVLVKFTFTDCKHEGEKKCWESPTVYKCKERTSKQSGSDCVPTSLQVNDVLQKTQLWWAYVSKWGGRGGSPPPRDQQTIPPLAGSHYVLSNPPHAHNWQTPHTTRAL